MTVVVARGRASAAAMEDATFSDDFCDGLDRLLRLRRDVRRFRRDPVAIALAQRVFDSMASAPSVGLSQPWRIVRFESEAARAAARAAFASANAAALAAQPPERAAQYASLKLAGLDDAPVQFAVFCDEECAQGAGLGRMTMPEMLRYSCVCAVMQAWLTARTLGLGLGWVSIIEPELVRRAAVAPPSWSLIGYFCLGWPEASVDDTPELERLAWERRRSPETWRTTV